VRISRALWDEIVAHARADAPNECCGMIAARDGAAVAVHRARNTAASPLRYEMDSMEQFRIMQAIEDDGLDLGAIYHSHTRSEPYPSQTDINFARLWPGIEWIIVGLDGDDPRIRSFVIDDGRVVEMGVERG
jgi:[CysO sulfur-carrier protein]-S-L-cysteine hydrolase